MRRPSDLPEGANRDLRRLHAAAVAGVRLVNARQREIDEKAAEVQRIIDAYERAKEARIQLPLPDLDVLLRADQRRSAPTDLL